MGQTAQLVQRRRLTKTHKSCESRDTNNKPLIKKAATLAPKANRTQKRIKAACKSGLESLELRCLMSTVNVADFGATPGGSNNAAAIQAALNATKPGDTVTIPAGTYNINAELTVPSGITITGAANFATHLNFSLSGSKLFGFYLNANDSNVTIEQLDMVSTNGVIEMVAGNQYNNITITNNRMEYGTSGNNVYPGGLGIFASIYSGGLNEGLQITHNYFHDSPNTDRNWEIWYAQDATLDYNTFYNIHDGGHLMQPKNNVSFSYNYGTHIIRMGQEIENQGADPASNLQVVGNTFFDWITPYPDSFGLSVVSCYSVNTLVADNYLDADIAPGSTWGPADGGGTHRFGIGIEIGGVTATVKDNTIIGGWATGVAVAEPDTVIEGNKKYGPAGWGDWITEPGDWGGGGAFTLSNNTVDRNIADAPAPPANTTSSGSTGTGSTGTGSTGTGSTGTGSTGTGSTGTGSTGTGSTGTGGSSAPVTPPTAPVVPAAPIIGATPGATQISSLTPVSETNGWGPAETNESNGEIPAGDGHTLTLDGQRYATGMGVHAPSTLTYNLNGQYTSFLSYIGIDDETGGLGQVVFQVWGDGKELYASSGMKGGEAAKSINVNVTGVKQLQLIVVSDEVGDENNHADWADARLVPITVTVTGPVTTGPSDPEPPPTTGSGSSGTGSTGTGSSGGTTTNPSKPVKKPKKPSKPSAPVSIMPKALQKMHVQSDSNGYGAPGMGEANNNSGPLRMGGKTYTNGVGVAATSKLVYALNGNYNKFVAEVGLDDAALGNAGVAFEVWADGHEIYNSGELKKGQEKYVDVRVTGKEKLTLVVENFGDPYRAEADWIDAHVK